MPDNFLIVPSADVQGGRLTTLSNAISTTDLNLTVTGLSNDTELVVYQLSTGVIGTPQAAAQPRETHVFALMGQSNMIGRAAFDGGAKWPDGTLQIGRGGDEDGAIIPARNPADGPATSRPLAHTGARLGNMGLDIQFAIDYLSDKPDVTLLFIPCAQGATGFSNGAWNPGDWLYNRETARINAAMNANPEFLFQGFLWHQGETDTGIPGTYGGLLDNLIAGLRRDVTAATPTTPFILGGLAAGNAGRDAITGIIAATPGRVPYTAFAPTADLSLTDANHFDAASFRTLGARYAAALASAAANQPGAPGIPTGLSAVAGDTEVTLSWSAPANTGGTALSDYIIERDSGSGFAALADGTGTTTGYTDSGLSNGTTYAYRVRAVNGTGTGAATPPQSATPAAPATGPVAEAGAQAHWLFGADNPTYADLVSGRIATGPAHALEAAYMTSPAGIRQGRDTGIAEADAQTMCFVFQLAGSANSMIGGTLTTSGSNGVSPYTSATTGIYANMRGGWGNPAISSASPYRTQFVFAAVSKNVATGNYVLFAGNGAGHDVLTGTSAQTTSPRTIGIGNLHFDRANFSGQISIAEAILFDSAKTEIELTEIYDRSRTRLAARGLTVV
ncbi:hypothetical protein CEP88_20120 (plasmid) [Roseobacter denitrificans]|uniref:Conserved domain protein n=1 Tax=Roseobacter denitrificans (strain ATCC 33942 / OCh 114) TaxID=375451 RepID=Q07GI7_ROSDO|nr:sialate O-acetylesterase [Roseobacter denitrificans]ABI93412.1 conserved domain protein [Roseobacter denitrificans OCh 114]AVL55112.1 hypothetical protein CEP88_20120 [Roseobacter denitrificans]SFG43913.1 Fibronectin type III domain-containing protein [Roseobacter denitrificans OCh 114]